MTFRRDPNLIHWIKFDVTQHTDHLGSPVAGTDAVGNVAWRERYTPYGEKMLNPTALDNQASFTGHIHDAKTGLTYMQARYYDPNIGRFLSIDPVNISDNGNHNFFARYHYAFNDPVNAIDPDGRETRLMVEAEHLDRDVVEGRMTRQERQNINVAQMKGAIAGLAVILPGPEDVVLGAAATTKTAQVLKGALTGRKAAKGCCFVAGTLVETKEGLKPIETLQEGDLVLSRNQETGETAYKTVTAFIPRHQRVIWTVELSSDKGSTEFFETTDEHPWWIVDDLSNGRWLRTDELQVGMTVTTVNNQTMTIYSVIETDRVDGTYNITVADFETYFVGENRILVHNCPPDGSYTNTHESGKTYDGKGDAARAATSGRRVAKQNNDPVFNTETRAATSERESFKQESRSLDANGGPKSDNNYNKIESPGKRYRQEDGEID